MPDRHGLPLRPGDPVLIQDAVTGTVLRELPDNCYLVQLDPDAPRDMTGATPAQIAMRDQLDALVADAGSDVQEPMEFTGDELVYFGESYDDD